MQEAYLVAGYRTAVGKARKGAFRFTRPDDLAAEVIKHILSQVPQLEPSRIDDVIVGNAMPEAEQGLNMARMIALMSLPVTVAGMTINRYCASGLEAISIAAGKIRAGHAEVILAGGAESMSLIPIGGWKIVPNYKIAVEHPDWYYNMGLTAEAVAKEYSVSRDDQDAFAYRSHQRAVAAIEAGRFKDQIVPFAIEETYLDEKMKRKTRRTVIDTDESPRKETSIDALSKLKPVFADKGCITAGNSSPTSDGAAMVLVVSERVMKELNLVPLARMMSYHVTGVEPRLMGIGPVSAIPAAMKKAGLNKGDIQLTELNEAFASQSLAVIRRTELDEAALNVNGGAIALGHPLGVSGCKLTVQLIAEMQRRKLKYGMVTMCVGGGQGAAGIFEVFPKTENAVTKTDVTREVLTAISEKPVAEKLTESSAIDIKEEFEAAQAKVKRLKQKPDNESLLMLYALYKQATQGDAGGEKSSMFDMVGQAKFAAWSKQNGKTKEAAMREYVDYVDSLAAQK